MRSVDLSCWISSPSRTASTSPLPSKPGAGTVEVARATHLADTSAFARVHQSHVHAAAAPLVVSGRIALCAPVIFELGFSARNAADYDEITRRVGTFELAPTTDGDLGRALAIQRRLVGRGNHRAISLVDALVAAIAESRELVVLHYDADFDLIADATGQPTEWIVERGTAD